MSNYFILVGFVAAAAACGGRSSAGVVPASSRDELLAQIYQNEASAARPQNFVPALAGAFAPTGFFTTAGPSSPRGEEGARLWLGRDTANAHSRARWWTVFADVSDDGRDGYSFGYLDVLRANGDSMPGEFHAYWRRQADGSWRILAMSRGRRETKRAHVAYAYEPRAHRGLKAIDTAAVFAELSKTEVAFSDSSASGLAPAFAAFAEPTAAKIDGSVYIYGRTAIAGLFAQPRPGFNGIQWHPDVGTVAQSGDLGFTSGPVTPRGAPAANGPQGGGRYFTVWRRQADGTWKYVVD
jgi:ketosteroid isomerase-like protein